MILIGLVLVMGAYYEYHISQSPLPQHILLQMQHQGKAVEGGVCFADIESDVTRENVPLKALDSVYDFIDARRFHINDDNGFHVLDLNLTSKKYSIYIVCYENEFSGVSYKIITEKDRPNCQLVDGGKLMIC